MREREKAGVEPISKVWILVARILSDTKFLEGSCRPREAFGSLAHRRGVEGSRGRDQHLSDGRRQPEERL